MTEEHANKHPYIPKGTYMGKVVAQEDKVSPVSEREFTMLTMEIINDPEYGGEWIWQAMIFNPESQAAWVWNTVWQDKKDVVGEEVLMIVDTQEYQKIVRNTCYFRPIPTDTYRINLTLLVKGPPPLENGQQPHAFMAADNALQQAVNAVQSRGFYMEGSSQTYRHEPDG